MAKRLFGILAEFETHEALSVAVTAARSAGYGRLEAYSPFPLREVADSLGVRTTIIPWIACIAGFTGATVQFATQFWLNAVDYPLNVGGRPLNSWPAFVPSTLIVTILWAGLATLLGLLLVLRLPRLHHPVFSVPAFARASEDRFFLCILSDDPLFAPAEVARFLESLSPRSVQEVPACD